MYMFMLHAIMCSKCAITIQEHFNNICLTYSYVYKITINNNKKGLYVSLISFFFVSSLPTACHYLVEIQ